MLTFMLTCGTCACYITSWVWDWGGVGMLTFMLTCGTCACYITTWVWDWGGVGMLTFMLTCGTCACYVTSWVWGWGGVGMLTFMLTCGTCACYVTSWVWGWGGVGMLTFMLTCGTCACYVTWKAASESAARILASQALNFVKQLSTKKTTLITDGALCYPSLSAKFGWRHEACNHSKGLRDLLHQKRIGNKTILIHTGGVDAMWRLPKSAIPCSLATKVNSQVNPKLMQSIRVWQWRWLNSKENLLEKTGRTLQKRMAI